MNDSILTSIKLQLGVGDDYDYYDPPIIAAIMVLNQLGVGPPEGVVITGKDETWDLLVDGRTDLEAVKSNVFLRTQMIFDPPQAGTVIGAKERIQDMLDWRLLVQAEGGPGFGT